MLTCEDFRRRHQRALRAAFDGIEQRGQGDHRLARADVALQQPQHARRTRHIGVDFRDRLFLRARERKGQGGETLPLQLALAFKYAAFESAHARPDQQQRQLIGEQLVIGKPHARRHFGGKIAVALRRVRGHDRLTERWPAACLQQTLVQPFRQFREGLKGAADRFCQRLQRKVFRQPVHRLDE